MVYKTQIRLKMKKTMLLGLVLIITASFSYAQKKYGEDSLKCIQNLSLYRDYYKQKAYDDAYKFWRIPFKICPASSERMYVDGTNLLSSKIKAAQTEEEKEAYIDTLMMVYDQRIENFGNEGDVLGRKGTDLLRYRNDDVEQAFNALKKSIDLSANKSKPGAIASYMLAAVEMEKADKKTEAEVVEVFNQLSEILAFNISKTKGSKYEKYYLSAQENVEKAASAYLNCELLEKMAKEGFPENKSNKGWMERMANILGKKGCTDSEVFFKIAKQMHKDNPSANSAEKMGIMSLKMKNYSQAEGYFQQAIEMAESDDDKYHYYIELAQAQSSRGAYSNARASALKATKLKPGEGLPYIMIGDMIASSASVCKHDEECIAKAIYWLAVDYFIKAKSIDPSVSDKANQKIATYKKYFPEMKSCFFIDIQVGDPVKIDCWINETTKAR